LDKTNLAVFYYNKDTNKFELMDTKVDGNKVIVKTPHFSKFIISEKPSNSVQVLPKTGSNFGAMTLIALVTVIALLAAMIFSFKRVTKSNWYYLAVN
jgi:LPXTG-motif cell wall-anchored protein